MFFSLLVKNPSWTKGMHNPEFFFTLTFFFFSVSQTRKVRLEGVGSPGGAGRARGRAWSCRALGQSGLSAPAPVSAGAGFAPGGRDRSLVNNSQLSSGKKLRFIYL